VLGTSIVGVSGIRGKENGGQAFYGARVYDQGLLKELLKDQAGRMLPAETLPWEKTRWGIQVMPKKEPREPTNGGRRNQTPGGLKISAEIGGRKCFSEHHEREKTHRRKKSTDSGVFASKAPKSGRRENLQSRWYRAKSPLKGGGNTAAPRAKEKRFFFQIPIEKSTSI